MTNVNTDLAKMIDHTLLKPGATKSDLDKLCKEAIEYGFATCCVNSSNIPYVKSLLNGSNVKPISVVGFPLGASSSKSKAFEASDAISGGAEEIDMVINVGALKSDNQKYVFEDIKAVVDASKNIPVKVIIEASELTDSEKEIACKLAVEAGAAFVKTSTGFSGGGATEADITLMRKIVGPDIGVKASGGVRTTDDANKMINAGANRIGASSSIAIATGKTGQESGY